MAIFAGAPFRGCAALHVTRTGLTSTFEVTSGTFVGSGPGDVDTWEGAPGSSLMLTLTTAQPFGGAQAATSVVVTIHQLTGFAGQHGSVGPAVSTWTVNNPGNNTFTRTFHFDDLPLDQLAGTARAGVFVIVVTAESTGGVTPWTAQNSHSPPAGTVNGNTYTGGNGYLRAPFKMTTLPALSNVAPGGAEPALWDFDDELHARLTLVETPFSGVQMACGGRKPDNATEVTQTWQSAGQSTSTTHDVSATAAGSKIDNSWGIGLHDLLVRFVAATYGGDQVWVWATTGHHADLIRVDERTLREDDRMDVDPTIEVRHHFQVEDNVFDVAKDTVPRQMLNSDLGFVTFGLFNRGGDPLSGITVTEEMTHPSGLVAAAFTRSVATDADGYPALETWDSFKPGGGWDHDVLITAPAHAVGLEEGESETYVLLSKNPNFTVVCSAGVSTAAVDGSHWSPGMDLLAGLAVFDSGDLTSIPVDDDDAGNPRALIALARFNVATGRAQFLDGSVSEANPTWENVEQSPAVQIYEWQLTSIFDQLGGLAGDERTYTRTFPAALTAAWGEADLFILGTAFIDDTPYVMVRRLEVMGSLNAHDTADALPGPIMDVIGMGTKGKVQFR